MKAVSYRLKGGPFDGQLHAIPEGESTMLAVQPGWARREPLTEAQAQAINLEAGVYTVDPEEPTAMVWREWQSGAAALDLIRRWEDSH